MKRKSKEAAKQWGRITKQLREDEGSGHYTRRFISGHLAHGHELGGRDSAAVKTESSVRSFENSISKKWPTHTEPGFCSRLICPADYWRYVPNVPELNPSTWTFTLWNFRLWLLCPTSLGVSSQSYSLQSKPGNDMSVLLSTSTNINIKNIPLRQIPTREIIWGILISPITF